MAPTRRGGGERRLGAVAARRGVRLAVNKTHDSGEAAFTPWLLEQIGTAIAAEGIRVRKLPSGAGDDGMAIIGIADIGMLCLHSEKGISHNPAEAVPLDDVEIAARVRLRLVKNFDPAGKA